MGQKELPARRKKIDGKYLCFWWREKPTLWGSISNCDDLDAHAIGLFEQVVASRQAVRVLMALESATGPCGAHALGSISGVAPVDVHVVCGRLERYGLISTERRGSVRRYSLVRDLVLYDHLLAPFIRLVAAATREDRAVAIGELCRRPVVRVLRRLVLRPEGARARELRDHKYRGRKEVGLALRRLLATGLAKRKGSRNRRVYLLNRRAPARKRGRRRAHDPLRSPDPKYIPVGSRRTLPPAFRRAAGVLVARLVAVSRIRRWDRRFLPEFGVRPGFLYLGVRRTAPQELRLRGFEVIAVPGYEASPDEVIVELASVAATLEARWGPASATTTIMSLGQWGEDSRRQPDGYVPQLFNGGGLPFTMVAGLGWDLEGLQRALGFDTRGSGGNESASGRMTELEEEFARRWGDTRVRSLVPLAQ